MGNNVVTPDRQSFETMEQIRLDATLQTILQQSNVNFRDNVLTPFDLPLLGNSVDDFRMAISNGWVYKWNGAAWVFPTVAGGGGAGNPSLPLNSIQYNNGGVFGGDALATRDPVTNYTDILKDFSVSEQGGFKITADVSGGLIAFPVPGSFIVSENTVSNLYAAIGAGDISGILGVPAGLAPNSLAGAVYNAVTSDGVSVVTYYYDGSLGGTASFRHEATANNGTLFLNSDFVLDHTGFSAAADDLATSQTGSLSIQAAQSQIGIQDSITNFNTGFFAGTTGSNIYVRPTFTGTKDWTLSLIDNIGSDNVSLSFTNITDNDRFMLLDPATGDYIFGDENGAVGGNYLHIDETGGVGGLTNLWTTNFHVQSPNILNAPLIYIDGITMHTRLGYNAGGNSSLLAGGQNTYVGYEAGFGSGVGSLAQGNTAVGYRAGYSLATTGDGNSLYGLNAGWQISTGQSNTISGYGAGAELTTESDNALYGLGAGGDLTSADNAMFGTFAGGQTTTGNNNSFFGRSAGLTNITGSSLILIGSEADVNAAGLNASIGIGREVQITASNQLLFGSATYPIYEVRIGDYLGAQNGMYLRIDDVNATAGLGDLNGAGNNTKITMNDTIGGQSVSIDAANVTQINSERIVLNGSQQVKRTEINDADYAIIGSDYLISVVNLSASRTITVPDASTFFAGRTFIIKDADGLANTWNIILDPAGTDTIDNATPFTMNVNYQSITLVSDGVSNREII